MSFLWISGPSHYRIEDGFSGPAEAPVVVTSMMSCVLHSFKLSEQLQVSRFLATVSVPSHLGATLRDWLTIRVLIFSSTLFVVWSTSSVVWSNPSPVSSIPWVVLSILFVAPPDFFAASSILRVASSILLVVSSILSVVLSVLVAVSLISLVFS